MIAPLLKPKGFIALHMNWKPIRDGNKRGKGVPPPSTETGVCISIEIIGVGGRKGGEKANETSE